VQTFDDGTEYNSKVLVSFEIADTIYNDVVYVGNLHRCYVGMKMNVYCLKDSPGTYAFAKSGDLGYALILTGGGLLWLVISGTTIWFLYRSEFFMNTNEETTAEK